MTTGEKIAALRKEHGMSQEVFSEKLGISRQAVSKWENGTAQPTSENLNQIAKLFGVTVSYLLDEEEMKVEEKPQEKPKTKKHNFVTAILVIAIVFQSISIFNLSRRVDKLNNQQIGDDKVYDEISRLHSEIAGLRAMIDIYDGENVTDNKGLVDSLMKSIDFDKENQTIDMKISFVLSEYTENSKAQVVIKNEEGEFLADAVLENNIFTAVVENVPCTDYSMVFAYLKEGDKTKTYSLGTYEDESIYYMIKMKIRGIEGEDHRPFLRDIKDGELSVKGQIAVEFKNAEKVYPVSGVMNLLCDGKVLKTYDFDTMTEYKPSKEDEYGVTEIITGPRTRFEYVNEIIKNPVIKKDSKIEIEVIFKDNFGAEIRDVKEWDFQVVY